MLLEVLLFRETFFQKHNHILRDATPNHVSVQDIWIDTVMPQVMGLQHKFHWFPDVVQGNYTMINLIEWRGSICHIMLNTWSDQVHKLHKLRFRAVLFYG